MAYLVPLIIASVLTVCRGQLLAPQYAQLRTLTPGAISTYAGAPLIPRPVAQAPLAYAVQSVPQQITVARPPAPGQVEQNDPHPQYSFHYEVNDPTTGDSKSQQESRDGDVVQGTYSLAEPDGSIRTVDYTADSVNGFNAVVHRQAAAHPPPARSPVAVSQPAQYAIQAQPQIAISTPQYTIPQAPVAIASQPVGYGYSTSTFHRR